MVCHFNGRYRSAIELKFLEQVEEEITTFWNSCGDNAVLVFPPLDPHYRFLIHQLIGESSRLQTVSVGQGRQRRTVVYFTSERDSHKMTQSQSSAEKTFFGRGRGRRTKKPDQALYVPGALRKAKNDKTKESASLESSTNITENEEISKSNSSINNGVIIATKDDPNKKKQCSQRYGTELNNTLQQDIPLSNEGLVDDIVAGIKRTYLEGNMQHASTNVSSDLFVNETLQIGGMGDEANKLSLPNSDNKIKFPKSSIGTLDEESDGSLAKVINERDQTLDTSSQSTSFGQENCCDKDVALENDLWQTFVTTGNGTTCKEKMDTCTVTVDTENDSCVQMNKKIVYSEQNQGIIDSRENDSNNSNPLKTETQSHKDDSISIGNVNDPPFDKQKAETKGGLMESPTDLDLPVDDQPTISVFSRYENANEARSETAALHNGSDIIIDLDDSVKKESYRILTDPGGDQQEEKVQNKGCLDDRSQSEATLKGVESSSVVDEAFLQPCGAMTDVPVAKPSLQMHAMNVQFDHQSLSVKKHTVKQGEDGTQKELVCSQLSMSKEDINDKAGIRSMEMTSKSVHEHAENCGNHPSCTLDVSPTSLVLEKDLASQRFNSDVGHLSECTEELHAQTENTGEKAQEVLEEKHSVSNLSVAELKENVGELEMEHDKTTKKKKRKKDKDGKEEKSKSKDKGEKTKRKDKKNSKEKSDKDENLDSKQKEKKHKKSKNKEQSSKQGDTEDLNTCGKIIERESSTQSKLQTGSSIKKHDNDSEDDDDDDWESNFNESGDCLNPEHLEELTRLTGKADLEVHKTQFDFYSFVPKEVELDDEEFGHIVEIYNFSADLKTQDLMQALSSFRSKGFDIKWVDDTHALAVFSSRHTAQDAIKLCSGPLMKLRPVSEGTTESKKKASWCSDLLQPYKERPQTSKLLADRMVTGALGIKSKMTREERAKEREKLKEAKTKRQEEKMRMADIWGD